MNIYETIIGDINESTSLKERAEICVGLRNAGWTQEQAEAATGLKWTLTMIMGITSRSLNWCRR